MKIKINGLRGCGMSHLSLDLARKIQMFHDIPDANICFSTKDLLKRLEDAKKKEKFMLIEGVLI